MIGWFDTAAGASGDMLLGALVGSGVPLDRVRAAVAVLPVEPVEFRESTVERHSLGATKVDVIAPESHHHRAWRDIRAMLESADLSEAVAAFALGAFGRLARAEAAAHRVAEEDVHFHEVGALDAIADVVGTAAAVVELGADRFTAGTVTLGHGTTSGAHGRIPVPAPAALSVLADAGAPVAAGPAPYEMCTPTGAALLAEIVTDWGPMPPMRVDRVGVGAGTRDVAEVPNLLRLVLGEPERSGPRSTAAVVLEANVDDLDPRLWPDVLDELLAAGAQDAWLTPILMKKGRSAHCLHALCGPERVDRVRAVIFASTSTIGLREREVTKRALDRYSDRVTVEGHPVGVKVATMDGRVVNVSVEYEDARRVARAIGKPIKEVLRAAMAKASGW